MEHPIKREFDLAYGLVEGKANDYAERDDVFSNFKFAAAAAGITVEQVFLVMIGTKVARLTQLLANTKTPNFESIEDTMLDLINYSGLLSAWRRHSAMETFMAEEEDWEGVPEAEYASDPFGLIDAVFNDPLNEEVGRMAKARREAIVDEEAKRSCPWGEFDEACDECKDDAAEGVGSATVPWEIGDEFYLAETGVWGSRDRSGEPGYRLTSEGPYVVNRVMSDGIGFNGPGGQYLLADWDEIERY